MKNNLKAIDDVFNAHYKGLYGIQLLIKNQLESYPFDLSKTEITDAIIERMFAFWHFHVGNNKNILGRVINTTAADFFTETCLLFLKCYFEQQQGIQVYSEKKLKPSNLRPDISIWKNDRLVAVIELKVSNGWKGKNMYEHLEYRARQIQEIAPSAYFGVLAYWNFFDISHSTWNTRYFSLMHHDSKHNHTRTSATVEKLILQVNKRINSLG